MVMQRLFIRVKTTLQILKPSANLHQKLEQFESVTPILKEKSVPYALTLQRVFIRLYPHTALVQTLHELLFPSLPLSLKQTKQH